jgi:hypothetical protein
VAGDDNGTEVLTAQTESKKDNQMTAVDEADYYFIEDENEWGDSLQYLSAQFKSEMLAWSPI